MPDEVSELQVNLELESSVWETARHVAPQIAEAVGTRINEMMRALGVPGKAVVGIDAQPVARKWVQLRVEGKLCRYPDILLNNTRAYIAGAHRDAETNLGNLLTWIKNEFAQKPQSAIATVAQICEAIIERQPAMLMHDKQTEAWASRFGDNYQCAELQKHGASLKSVLKAVLETRCSLPDGQCLNRSLSANPADETAIVDRVTHDYREDIIEIRAGKALHDTLVTEGREKELLSFARDGLYQELGLLFYSRIALIADAALLPTALRFRINCLDTTPVLGVGTGQILVNDTVERIRSMGEEAIPTSNIATDQPAAIAEASRKFKLEEAGLTVWDPWGFVILALAEVLRQNAACFVSSNFTSMQLRRLARDYPKLVNVSRRQTAVEMLTLILRGLVEERISIRDLKLILERLLDCRYASDPLSRYVVLDDRLTTSENCTLAVSDSAEWKLEFVRAGLRSQLANVFSRKTGTLVVYLLSNEIERLVMFGSDGNGGPLNEVDATRILEAIHEELAHLPPTALRPLLLTCGAARRKLSRLVQTEIPRMSVLAHEELPRGLNVQPIARISLSA